MLYKVVLLFVIWRRWLKIVTKCTPSKRTELISNCSRNLFKVHRWRKYPLASFYHEHEQNAHDILILQTVRCACVTMIWKTCSVQQFSILGTFFKSRDCSCLWLLEGWFGYWHDELSNKIAAIKLIKLSTVSHEHIFPLFQCTHKKKYRLSCFLANKKQRNLRSCWSNAKRI